MPFVIAFIFFSYIRSADKPDDPDQQTLRLTNERFAIPEVLFHPSDVGIKQASAIYMLPIY